MLSERVRNKHGQAIRKVWPRPARAKHSFWSSISHSAVGKDKNADPQSSALDSLPSLLQSTGPTLNTEDAGEALMQRALEGASFRMHLGGGADGMGRRYTLWGQGGYRSLSAQQDGIAFSGGLSGLHLGADTRLSDTLLAGVAVSHSSAQMDYTETYRGEVLEGAYGFTLSGVHPYADWQHTSGLGVWLSAGASRGEVQVWDRALEEQQDAVRNALSVHALSGGVERPLARRGVWGLAFKADGSVSDVTVSDVGSADDLALRVSRLRMSVQADWELGVWSPYAELGLRHDGGAGGSSMGLEAGGGVRYSGSSGWQFEGEARSLALGSGSRREWQLQATLSRQPAAGAGGFRMRLSPAYGPAGGMSGVLDRLWSDGMSGSVAPALGGLLDAGAYQSRLDLELGYGWPVNRGLVELYGGGSAMAGEGVNPAASSSGRLHVGGRFEATAGWHVRLELQWGRFGGGWRAISSWRHERRCVLKRAVWRRFSFGSFRARRRAPGGCWAAHGRDRPLCGLAALARCGAAESSRSRHRAHDQLALVGTLTKD